MAEREERCAMLRASIAKLHEQETQLVKEIAEIKSNLRGDPSATVERHIHLLHEYNEIKDVAQGLIGMIADTKGVRVVEIYKEYGVSEKD